MSGSENDEERDEMKGRAFAAELVIVLLTGHIAAINSRLNGSDFTTEVERLRESIETSAPTTLSAARLISDAHAQGVEDFYEDIAGQIRALRTAPVITLPPD